MTSLVEGYICEWDGTGWHGDEPTPNLKNGFAVAITLRHPATLTNTRRRGYRLAVNRSLWSDGANFVMRCGASRARIRGVSAENGTLRYPLLIDGEFLRGYSDR
jgi:hypothetical protein